MKIFMGRRDMLDEELPLYKQNPFRQVLAKDGNIAENDDGEIFVERKHRFTGPET